MTMNKRSMAELRKLRKRDDILTDAMSEIKARNDEALNDERITEVVDWCLAALKEVGEKEAFLQKLELPKHDKEADSILKKIRNRAAKPTCRSCGSDNIASDPYGRACRNCGSNHP